MTWGDIKLDLGALLGMSNDAMHFHVGMLLLFVAALVLRRPPWTWPPLVVVIVAEVANEIYDLNNSIRLPDESGWPDSIHDLILTLVWPVAIVLLFPLFRYIDRRKASAAAERIAE